MEPQARNVLFDLEQIIFIHSVHFHVFLSLVNESSDKPLHDIFVGEGFFGRAPSVFSWLALS